jgi:hypothetical protein
VVRQGASWIVGIALASALSPRAARADDSTQQAIDARGGLTIGESAHLPGQSDGTTAALGYGVDGSVRYVRGRNVFSAVFHIVEGLTFSPLTGKFVKSLDDTRIRTAWAFKLTPWFDIGAWAVASVPLFGSSLEEPQAVDFDILRADGLHAKKHAPGLELTQPFLPLKALEIAGVAFHPLARGWLSVDVRGGLGADHALADEQLIVIDERTSRQIEVREIESHHAFTPAVELTLSGSFEDRLSYELDARVRWPLAYTTNVLTKDMGIPELTMVDLRFDLSVQILPWLTTDYELLVERNPFLSPDVGVGNRLMLAAHPTAHVRHATDRP